MSAKKNPVRKRCSQCHEIITYLTYVQKRGVEVEGEYDLATQAKKEVDRTEHSWKEIDYMCPACLSHVDLQDLKDAEQKARQYLDEHVDLDLEREGITVSYEFGEVKINA